MTRLARRKPKRKRSWSETAGFLVIGVAVVAIIWLVFFTSPQNQGPTQTTYSLAPDFTLTDVDGNPFRLSSNRGKVVVLEFMRTTCPACITQESNLRELRSRFGDDVVMVMVSVDPATDTDSLLGEHRDRNVPGWIAMGDRGQVYLRYSVQSTPTIFIIDKDGYIRHQHVGVTESTVLINEVETLRR